MTVSEQSTITRHIANGTTATFAAGFAVASVSEIDVYIGDILQSSSAWSYASGNIVLAAIPSSGSVVSIQRVTLLERETSYTNNTNQFLPRVLDADLDRIWRALQDINSNSSRALVLPISDTSNPAVVLAALRQLLIDFPVEVQARIDGDNELRQLVTTLVSGFGLENGSPDSYVVVKQPFGGSVARTQHEKNAESLTVADFKSPSNTWTQAFQAAIDAANAAGGKTVRIPAGEYTLDQITMRSFVVLQGDGVTNTILKQTVGANRDFVVGTNVEGVGLLDVTLDGNYFLSAWNAETGLLGNTSGGGVIWSAYAFQLRAVIKNIAGIGFLSTAFVGTVTRPTSELSWADIVGADYGKEGIIIKGPSNGDWELRRAIIGRAGILPRPSAETEYAVSDFYDGEPVDGIVIDRNNIEIGLVHVYACWSGTGFRTRDICRLTSGGVIISESNRAQLNIGNGTYGSANFDIRNLSLYHPDRDTRPTYTQPDPTWDGATIDAAKDFKCTITCKRTLTAVSRVVGTTAVRVSRSANVSVVFSNNTASNPLDPEVGEDYSGDALFYDGFDATLHLDSVRCNGNAMHVKGINGLITLNVNNNGELGAGLRRDTAGNSLFANQITGTISRSKLAFRSIGQPSTELINLNIRSTSEAEVVFQGDAPRQDRDCIWNITAVLLDDGLKTLSTRKTHSFDLDATSTAPRFATFKHGYLYPPSMRMVQISVDDRATPTSARLGYISVNSITDTEITIAYKFDISDSTPAANLRANVLIMQGGGGNADGTVTIVTPAPDPEDEDTEIDYLAIFNAALEA